MSRSRTLERAIAELVREQASVASAIERCEHRLEELQARAEVIADVLEPLRKALPAGGGGVTVPRHLRGDRRQPARSESWSSPTSAVARASS